MHRIISDVSLFSPLPSPRLYILLFFFYYYFYQTRRLRARSTPLGRPGRPASEGGLSIRLAFRSSLLARHGSRRLCSAEGVDFLEDSSHGVVVEHVAL